MHVTDLVCDQISPENFCSARLIPSSRHIHVAGSGAGMRMVQSAARSAPAASSCDACPWLHAQARPPHREELEERGLHLAAMAHLVEHLHNQQVQSENRILSSHAEVVKGLKI